MREAEKWRKPRQPIAFTNTLQSAQTKGSDRIIKPHRATYRQAGEGSLPAADKHSTCHLKVNFKQRGRSVLQTGRQTIAFYWGSTQIFPSAGECLSCVAPLLVTSIWVSNLFIQWLEKYASGIVHFHSAYFRCSWEDDSSFAGLALVICTGSLCHSRVPK